MAGPPRAVCVAFALCCSTAWGLKEVAGVASALEAGYPAIPPGVFQIGEHVQVRDSQGEGWKVGTVSSLQPFKVTPDGWDTSFRWKYVRPSAAQHRSIVATPVASAAEEPAAALAPQLPDQPGCYVWMPSGCPKNSGFRASVQWHRDDYGEEHGALSKQACLARARSFNSWCGAADARMHLVLPKAPPAPTEPGCYVRHPSGCPKQNLRAQNSWRRDAHGEDAFHAAESQSVCETDRKRNFDSWCGTDDTEMLFVDKDGHSGVPAAPMLAPSDAQGPAATTAASPEAQVVREPGMPELPSEPGCFVWMPSGCPRTRSFKATTAWKRDEYGEEEKGARMSKKACQARASSFNGWCGATDARMLFIATLPPAAPTTPGCYVFHRSGCPRQSMHVRNEWQRDAYGEGALSASELKEVCEIQRKRSFDVWCGVDDTAMMFVPKTIGSQDAADPTAEGVPVAIEAGPAAAHNASAQADRSVESLQGESPPNPKDSKTANVGGGQAAEVADANATTEVQATDASGVAGERGDGRASAAAAGRSQAVGQRITNLNGQQFQLRQPGSYTLLQLGREGAPELTLRGRVEASWPCTLFVREVAIAGSALGTDTPRIRAGGRRRDGHAVALKVEAWQDGSWTPLAGGARDESNFTSGTMALKTYDAEGNSVRVYEKASQDASEGERGGSVEILAGDIAVHVALSGSRRTPWLDVALEGAGAAAPEGNSGGLSGLLARSEPDQAWLQPTEECAQRLGRNIGKITTVTSPAA